MKLFKNPFLLLNSLPSRRLVSVLLSLVLAFYIALPTSANGYKYDAVGRLIEILCDSGSRTSFTFDLMGNITTTTFFPPGTTIVSAPRIYTSPGSLPPGVVGDFYSIRIEAENYSAFFVSEGKLPEGLLFGNNGTYQEFRQRKV
jgi:YD repeat-containing protein